MYSLTKEDLTYELEQATLALYAEEDYEVVEYATLREALGYEVELEVRLVA